MDYLLPLILSALLINTVHASLLVFHKVNRKWTISEHAVLDKTSFWIYVAGHLLNGALFLVFAQQYFLDTVNQEGLFMLSVWTVVFEYIQALLPAKDKTNALHTFAALVMWASFILLGLLCIAFLTVEPVQKVAASVLYTGLFAGLFFASRQRQKTYLYQMVMVALFYAALVILVA